MAAMDLSKMGTAKVVLNTSDCNQIVIEKWPVSDVEWAFYLYAATELNQAGIATPTLLSADATLRKLRLEYIPYKVDQTAVANDYAIAMLGRLHRYPANSEWLYHTYTWTETALENALMLLALPEKNARQLRRFQQNSNALFACQSLVSGDRNAGNWGRRESGNLVLFDWERFGKGSPAIDLAPPHKGNGEKTRIYRPCRTLLPAILPSKYQGAGQRNCYCQSLDCHGSDCPASYAAKECISLVSQLVQRTSSRLVRQRGKNVMKHEF